MKRPSEKHQPVLAAIGSLVLTWNAMEDSTRNLILLIVGRTPGTQILTANIGSVAICDALRTAANELTTTPVRDHVLNVITHVEILRTYRNYYVHGFSGIGGQGSEAAIVADDYSKLTPIGFLGTSSAKSRLTRHELSFTPQEIEETVALCRRAHHYLVDIFMFIHGSSGASPTPSLPEMLPPPDRLQKPRRFPLDA